MVNVTSGDAKQARQSCLGHARWALALDALDALDALATDATDALDALDALWSAAAAADLSRAAAGDLPRHGRRPRALGVPSRSTRARGRTRRAARGARARGGGARGELDQRAAANARRSSSTR